VKRIYYVPNRCVGCEECVVACGKTHGGESRAFVEIVDGYFPFPMRCHHCADAPCRAACPTGAIATTESGMVVVDPNTCIGCGTCAVVCPFGIPRLSPTTHKIVKCDGCDEVVLAGGVPQCVAACPKGALQYGEETEALAGRRLRLASHIKAALSFPAVH
jgi:Fe-S-cluster-containing dehydrogenase component